MKRILFFIPTLSHGGAEKVLVNLVNNMEKEKYEITVQTLFDGGVNRQFLKKHIRYKSIFKKSFKGNSQILKLFSIKYLYKRMIKDEYDIIVSYLEGPTARIVSGCPNIKTKLVSWIHVEQNDIKTAAYAFRSPKEAEKCYNRFDKIICVSEAVKRDFLSIFHIKNSIEVLYNTNETEEIIEKSEELLEDGEKFNTDEIKLIGVGKLIPTKGFERLLNVHIKMREMHYPVHTYILGIGPEKERLEKIVRNNNCCDSFTFLGYKTNPYKYVARCDVFVCSSYAEGFSTAAAEALIVGTPVVTTLVSGMEEMLGYNNEYGIITDNNEDDLFKGVCKLVEDPECLKYYTKQAILRGKIFDKKRTVSAVEKMFDVL